MVIAVVAALLVTVLVGIRLALALAAASRALDEILLAVERPVAGPPRQRSRRSLAA